MQTLYSAKKKDLTTFCLTKFGESLKSSSSTSTSKNPQQSGHIHASFIVMCAVIRIFTLLSTPLRALLSRE
jgi:hypothetical protein